MSGPRRWPLPFIADPAAGRYARAFRALCQNAIEEYDAGTTGETPESGPLNDAVIGTKRSVPRWRRALISRPILRELDYWNRMRGGAS
jgi:hypothetical protein